MVEVSRLGRGAMPILDGVGVAALSLGPAHRLSAAAAFETHLVLAHFSNTSTTL